MNSENKIYLAGGCAICLVIAVIAIYTAWSNHKIATLERQVESAKAAAAEKQSVADELENSAAQYKAKNEYLEQQIAGLQATARKQDEQLQTLSKTTDSARADVDRTRRVRSVATTADDLCAKLADLGHPCE